LISRHKEEVSLGANLKPRFDLVLSELLSVVLSVSRFDLRKKEREEEKTMSRYFTSPPPVYARNWANGQNLVEWTKVRRALNSCD